MTSLRTLVSAPELRSLQARGDVLVIDCRFDLTDPAKGERAWLAGHVPGAVYAHLDRDLSDLSKRGLGRHPLPDDTAFSASLSGWGWRPDLDVVVYDDANGALAAARLWWMLRLVGHERVAVLDGGLAAWKEAGFPLESAPVQRTHDNVHVRFDTRALVGFDELEQRRQQASSRVLDARALPRYRGEVEPLDPVAGHVPGALNRPFADNLDSHGHFKPAQALRAEYEAILAGVRAQDTIHMCGSGVTACHNLLAMEHAGLTGSRVFAPSWSGWVSDPTRAVATL